MLDLIQEHHARQDGLSGEMADKGRMVGRDQQGQFQPGHAKGLIAIQLAPVAP